MPCGRRTNLTECTLCQATDLGCKPVVNPTGDDAVLIVDLAIPESPKIVATLKLENSIVGPPVNLAISPNGAIALVADAMTVAEDNGVRAIGHYAGGFGGAGADGSGRRRKQASVQPVKRHGELPPNGSHRNNVPTGDRYRVGLR